MSIHILYIYIYIYMYIHIYIFVYIGVHIYMWTGRDRENNQTQTAGLSNGKPSLSLCTPVLHADAAGPSAEARPLVLLRFAGYPIAAAGRAPSTAQGTAVTRWPKLGRKPAVKACNKAEAICTCYVVRQ